MSEIVERAVADFVPYAHNPRNNDAVVGPMAVSIRDFGFKVPILALSDGTIVYGHLRQMAAGAGQSIPPHGEQISLLGGMGHGTAPFRDGPPY